MVRPSCRGRLCLSWDKAEELTSEESAFGESDLGSMPRKKILEG